MSSGLTYLSIYDGSTTAPEVNAGLIAFALYDEAYEWGRWYTAFAQTSQAYVLIKTFTPADSGYWTWDGTDPVFTIQD